MKEVNIISKVVSRGKAEALPSASMPNMAGYATMADLQSLKELFDDFLSGDDADVVINRWKDVEEFLAGISEEFDLLSMLGLKADKADLANYVTIGTAQTITGLKDFTGGIKVNGSPIVYDAVNKYWKLEGDLLVTGGITMFGSDSAFKPSTIMDAIATDNVNLKVVDGVLTFVGSSGGLSEVHWDDVIGRPTLLSSFIDDVVDGHYLPLSGGQMTGNIGYTLEKGGNIPFAGAFSYSSLGDFVSKKSFIGNGQNTTSGRWYHLISVRADNGNDNYGMYIGCSMTDYQGSLFWNRQEGHNGAWQGERVILDSVNWSQYISAADGGNYLPLSGGTLSGLLRIDFLNSIDNISSAVGLHVLRSAAQSDEWGAGIALTAYQGKGSVIMSGGYGGTITYYNGYSYLDRAILRWDNKGNLFVPNVMFEKGGSVAEQYKCGMYMWDNILQITKRQLDLTYIKEMMTIDLPNERIKCHVITEFTDYIQADGRYAYIESSSFNSVAASGGWAVGHILRRADKSFMGFSCGGFGTGDTLSYYFYGGDYDAHAMRLIGNNMLVTGGITMYSDRRKKTILNNVELTLQQIADAPLIEHYYNSDTNKTTHVGSIAQYWASMNDWFCKLDGEGFYTMEIQNAALASAISIARELVKYESKTDKEIRMLKDEVKRLKKEIKRLKSA